MRLPEDPQDHAPWMDDLQEAQAEVNRARGAFLSAMIEIEGLLERAILYYFAPDELPVFVDAVLGPMTLVRKVELYRRIVKELDLYDDDRRVLLKEIDELRRRRNDMAHAAMRFVGNSYRGHRDSYELHVSGEFDRTPDPDSTISLADLDAQTERAGAAFRQLHELGPALVDAHEVPKEYFYRPGWDPRGRFEH